MASKEPESRTRIVLAIILTLAVLAAFGRALTFGFVNRDDLEYIVHNSHVSTGVSAGNFLWALTAMHASTWQPLTWLSLQLDASLFSMKPFGFHLTNLLLHLAGVLLLFFWLCRVTRSTWKSAFAALIFAVHPLRVESVVWVAERKDVLSGLFFFLTLWAYTRYVEVPGKARYLLVAAAFALGLMAKPMLVTLPVLLLLLDYWPLSRRRDFGASPAEAVESHLSWKKLVAEKIPLFAMAGAVALVTIRAQAAAIAPVDKLPMARRLATAPVAGAAYIGDLLWPRNLAAVYPYPPDGWPVWQIAVSIVVLAAISFGVWRMRARRYPVVGWLWYLLMLVPVIGLIQVGPTARADRFTYLPQIGLAILFAWGIPSLLEARSTSTNGRPRQAGLVGKLAGAVLALALVGASWVQAGYWKDDLALWQHTAAVTKQNLQAQWVLASLLAERGRVEEANRHFQLAREIKGDIPLLLIDQAACLFRSGRPEEAEATYRAALNVDPASPEAHNGLALVLQHTNRTEEAVLHLQEAIRLRPSYAEAHYNLGAVYARLGKFDSVMAESREAIRLRPGYVDAHYNLAAAYAQLGQLDAAIQQCRETLRLRPDHAMAKSLLTQIQTGRVGSRRP